MSSIDWNSWRRKYLDWFKSANIENSLHYLSTFLDVGTVEDVRREAKEAETLSAIQEIGLHGFERGAQARDQQIAFVNINPKLGLPIEGEVYKDTNYELGTVDVRNTILSRTKGCHAGINWLLTQKGEVGDYVDVIFEELSKSDKIPSKFSPPQADQVESLTEHMYYTNWFKYATENENLLKKWLKSGGEAASNENELTIPSRMLDRELEEVNPELVIISGKQPWTKFCCRSDAEITPVPTEGQTSSVSSTTYKVHGHLYQYTSPSGFQTKVVPVYHTSGMGYGQNARHLPGNELEETASRLAKSFAF